VQEEKCSRNSREKGELLNESQKRSTCPSSQGWRCGSSKHKALNSNPRTQKKKKKKKKKILFLHPSSAKWELLYLLYLALFLKETLGPGKPYPGHPC
jgi:hypothetical protein